MWALNLIHLVITFALVLWTIFTLKAVFNHFFYLRGEKSKIAKQRKK